MASSSEAGEATKFDRWSTIETRTMLQIWSDESVQERLTVVKRNNAIFQDIAKQMRKRGYNKTALQIKTKLRQLKKSYYKVKEENNVSGSQTHHFDHFDVMDEVLGEKDKVSASQCDSMDRTEEPQVIIVNEDGEMSCYENSDESQSTVNGEGNGVGDIAGEGTRTVTRRRKRPRLDEEDVLQSLIELQKHGMEMEAKRHAAHLQYLKDMSAQQAAREEREKEFNITIIKMFTDAINNLAAAIKK